METVLNQQQQELLKLTRTTLGTLRDTLADAKAPVDERAALADSIRQLDELFLLVTAGEFNSGKSAFINALVGRQLLPEGVTPTTNQIYLLKYGEEVSQTPGPKGVIIQTAPVETLRNVNIVDTPGTNAIMREHEALTSEFIPRSDLVLFLTSADRPFTESERAFLVQIRDWGKKIVLVVNKIDILKDQGAIDQVIEFAGSSAHRLVGDIQGVFPVSAKLAQEAKAGEPRAWEASGFEPLENFIHDTLDDEGRFRLKLLNPLGVGFRLAKRQLAIIEEDLEAIGEDSQLLDDVHDQMTYYNDDMQRNFQARLGEIDSLLFGMEKRGRAFFDDTIRFGRIPDLVRPNRIQVEFEEKVVADMPNQIEARIDELVDWMVEQDLRQWMAVSEHLARRKQMHEDRIVGQSGPKEGTLAYDRQRLIDSIGLATNQAIAGFDKEQEATEMAESARSAVAGVALLEIGGLGIGAVVAALATATWLDMTGIAFGVTFMALGLLVLPARRRKANQELETKLNTLRQNLVGNLTDQFNREMRRGAQRIEDTVAPYTRFVRAEQEKLEKQQSELIESEAHITGLRNQLQAPQGAH
ncbi:MAG TPA: dynamin family protein [Patescibacteria group bacterium]|nr:dynamin family protein [Patescibacteria group bacterium]